MEMKISIIVPTLNAVDTWSRFSDSLLANLACVGCPPERVLVIDSSSTDQTVEWAKKENFAVHTIERREFDHGGTRQLAADLISDADVFVYLTQDAVLSDRRTIQNLLRAFENPEVGAAYGRQLPRSGASWIETHARLFNYPAVSTLRSLESRKQTGFKSIFFSNSFGAYRSEALREIGGFSRHTIFGEDTMAVARLHLAGWKTAYVAEAKVYHSHSYTWIAEFRRYFDIGVLHAREGWLLEQFGSTIGDGNRFFFSETKFLCAHSVRQLPTACLRTAFKLIGYRLGRRERSLGLGMKKRLSMNALFWEKNLPATNSSH